MERLDLGELVNLFGGAPEANDPQPTFRLRASVGAA
jgi:hypothetical protein